MAGLCVWSGQPFMLTAVLSPLEPPSALQPMSPSYLLSRWGCISPPRQSCPWDQHSSLSQRSALQRHPHGPLCGQSPRVPPPPNSSSFPHRRLHIPMILFRRGGVPCFPPHPHPTSLHSPHPWVLNTYPRASLPVTDSLQPLALAFPSSDLISRNPVFLL